MKQDQYHFNLIYGNRLIDKPLRPPDFVVDTLLSQGLHILAGLPKVGKSWLALLLAVTVAKGEPLWNMRTKPGTVLYLCLEDTEARIQNRLLQVTEDVPEGLHFCIESHVLGKGLEWELANYMTEYPDAVLVIIDTLQMVRGAGYDNTYANDYRDLSALKKIADSHGIAILLVHHLRKEPAEDVFNRISGTTGLSGAVDSSFTLVEERRGSGRATLSCIGRDIGFRELTLERNEDNVWELVSDSLGPQEVLGDRMMRLLSAAMEDRNELIGTPTELWYPFIPYGKVTLLQGDPGDGFMLTIAALLTRGEPLPFTDTGKPHEPIRVIYQTTEDDADDTIPSPFFVPIYCYKLFIPPA